MLSKPPKKKMSAQQQKIRRIVWTGAIAAVTATGAWYGAGLKTRSEIKQVWSAPTRWLAMILMQDWQKQEKQREATPAEKIAQLEEQRGGLIAKRLGLERKIKELEMRANGATREESMQGQERRR